MVSPTAAVVLLGENVRPSSPTSMTFTFDGEAAADVADVVELPPASAEGSSDSTR